MITNPIESSMISRVGYDPELNFLRAVVERIQLVIDQSPVKNYLDMLMADVAAAESLTDGRTAD